MTFLHDWRNFDLSKLMLIEHISFDAAPWLFLTNACQQVTCYDSANQEFADAKVGRNEQKGVLIADILRPSSDAELFMSRT